MTTPGVAIVVLAQCDQQSNETSPHDKAGRAAGRGDGPYRCHRERYAMAAPCVLITRETPLPHPA
jgi:hypothetical protein